MLVNIKLNTINRQQGFTLMEVMIASFVLAVGMLGSTAMMLRGMQEAENTNYEAVAVELAVNMAERMRANVQGVQNGAYDALDANTTPVDCTANYCSPSDVAGYHAYLWWSELQDLMPNASPTATVRELIAARSVNSIIVADATFTITVNWTRENRTSTDERVSAVNSYVMIFQP